ncbi:MAG: transketolase family protein [Treponema sp.]|jgi:transketolase|nr:transketolase family protein [Treponema sp.]
MKWSLKKGDGTTPELRKVFLTSLQKIMDVDPRVLVLDADLGGASGFLALKKSHPNRFIEMGIAEANMIGVAAGLSMQGFIPFLHSFSPFVSRRVADQIYLEGSFAHNTINIYASDPGICAATNGGTHMTFEDIAFMRAVPDTMIFHPADAVQLGWLVQTLVNEKGVHYIRAGRKAVPDIYEDGSEFKIGKANLLKSGKDILIVSAGELLCEAMNAAGELEQEGISVSVADMFTIKPFDTEMLSRELPGKKAVISLENHSVYGGLGSAVAESMADQAAAVPLRRLGIQDRHGQVGSIDYLKKEYGLSSADIVKAVRSLI